LVKNIATGQKERVNKLLLQISIRELHNGILLPPDQGGFTEAWDKSGRARISDTALRALLPEITGAMTTLTTSTMTEAAAVMTMKRVRVCFHLSAC
jgi:hypothetical protein